MGGSHLSRSVEGGRECWLFTPHSTILLIPRLKPRTFGLQVQLSNISHLSENCFYTFNFYLCVYTYIILFKIYF